MSAGGSLWLFKNHLCFYSNLFGTETKIRLRISEIIKIDASGNSTIELSTNSNQTHKFVGLPTPDKRDAVVQFIQTKIDRLQRQLSPSLSQNDLNQLSHSNPSNKLPDESRMGMRSNSAQSLKALSSTSLRSHSQSMDSTSPALGAPSNRNSQRQIEGHRSPSIHKVDKMDKMDAEITAEDISTAAAVTMGNGVHSDKIKVDTQTEMNWGNAIPMGPHTNKSGTKSENAVNGTTSHVTCGNTPPPESPNVDSHRSNSIHSTHSSRASPSKHIFSSNTTVNNTNIIPIPTMPAPTPPTPFKFRKNSSSSMSVTGGNSIKYHSKRLRKIESQKSLKMLITPRVHSDDDSIASGSTSKSRKGSIGTKDELDGFALHKSLSLSRKNDAKERSLSESEMPDSDSESGNWLKEKKNGLLSIFKDRFDSLRCSLRRVSTL